MRTTPAKYLTDFDSGKPLFYLLEVTSDLATYYWHTSPETFSLWPGTAASHGGSALTKDAGQIVDLKTGGLTAVEHDANIDNYGGGIGNVGDFTFTVLNQLEESAILDEDNFINRSAILRMGFVDTVNGVGLGDMLTVASYVVDTVEYFHWQKMVFHCVDPSMHLDKMLPDVVISKTSHPMAPDESIGKCLPYLYGDFQTYNETIVNSVTGLYPIHFEQVDVAPTVVTSYGTSKWDDKLPAYTIASHILNSIGTTYMFEGNVWGILHTDDYATVNTDYAGLDTRTDCKVDWYIVPMILSETDTTCTEATGNRFEWVPDRDISKDIYTATGLADLFFKLGKQGEGELIEIDPATNKSIQLFALWGTLTGASPAVVSLVAKIVGGGYLVPSTNQDFDSGDSHTFVSNYPDFGANTLTWDNLTNNISYGVAPSQDMAAEVNHLTVVIRSNVGNRFGTIRSWPASVYGARAWRTR